MTASLLVCLEIGLPRELARLARAGGRVLARGDYLALAHAAVTSPEQVIDASDERLRSILGDHALVAELRAGAERLLQEDAARATAAQLIAAVDVQVGA